MLSNGKGFGFYFFICLKKQKKGEFKMDTKALLVTKIIESSEEIKKLQILRISAVTLLSRSTLDRQIEIEGENYTRLMQTLASYREDEKI